jgi:hypothetical protein
MPLKNALQVAAIAFLTIVIAKRIPILQDYL